MPGSDPYFIEAVSRALDVLGLFRDGEDIRLANVMAWLKMIDAIPFVHARWSRELPPHPPGRTLRALERFTLELQGQADLPPGFGTHSTNAFESRHRELQLRLRF